jgi:hypothetical protein
MKDILAGTLVQEAAAMSAAFTGLHEAQSVP